MQSRVTAAMDRRRFLKLSAAGLAGIAFLGSAATGRVQAQAVGGPSPGSGLMKEFDAAAGEYGVPVGLLVAMGYVNTRWEMPDPSTNEYEKGNLDGRGSYGIMALVKNPTSDTLGEASRLTGIPEEKLKTDRAANIRGGAALLAASIGREKPQELRGFFGAVAGRGKAGGKSYKAVAGVGGGELYADQVFEALQNGASERTRSGENISLAARSLDERIGGR
ncbi:MAG TPA: hypothetical protein VHM16_00925 [Rubrobacteraceae bacterium]|nr:hypothetical protein [Rubrobacteraceae bacterium]